MSNLPEPEPKDQCGACRAPVVKVSGGRSVERTPAGRGNIALTFPLPGLRDLPAASRSTRTSWRFHACIAFSAANFSGKKRGEVANEIFRQLGSDGRRRR